MFKLDAKELTAAIKDSDLVTNLKKLNSGKVVIGFFKEDTHTPSETAKKYDDRFGPPLTTRPTDAATLATVLNYGGISEHNREIPARPFFDDSKEAIKEDILNNSVGYIMDDNFYHNMGEIGTEIIRNNMVNGSYASNAPITIELKGNDHPLIDDAQLLALAKAKVY